MSTERIFERALSAHNRGGAKTLACLLSACLAFAAQGAPNVFDDAVFWFRGGKDLNGDGYMKQGEFFDDLHADNDAHDNHNMLMTSYTGTYGGFKENAAFQNEQIVFPALGTNVVKDMRVLRISNVGKKSSGTIYYYPPVVSPHNIFDINKISNEYTIVSRIKLDNYDRMECLFRIGHDSSTKQGMMLGFEKRSTFYAGCKGIMGFCTPNSTGSNTKFQLDLPVPTNTWVDMAVVVGNGKLRVGVAVPTSLQGHNNNPTIAFAETDMWTDHCSLLTYDHYYLFGQNRLTAPKENVDTTYYFTGGMQQLAIWKRALSDQEVMAAFGMPRPAIFRTGFDNGASNEFGGTRSGSSQEIDGLGSWQGVWDEMQAGDTWTLNFNAMRDEAGLPQIFSIKSLSDSDVAQIEPILTNASHNTSLGERRVAADGRTFWPVSAGLIAEGVNTLIIKRKNDGAGTFRVDAMELGGSLGVGTAYHSIRDGRVYPELIATGVPSAADPNPAHWPVGFRPYQNDNTNLQFRVWVDPDVVGFSSSSFKTCFNCYNPDNPEYTGDGSESFTIFVNGNAVTNCPAYKDWKDLDLPLSPDVLPGGWNKIEIRSDDKTCHWLFDRYRFETVLPRGFSLPPLGMSVIIR